MMASSDGWEQIQGHPNMRKVPGIEMSAGSLGQGFSAAVEWLSQARLIKILAEYMCSLVTENFKRESCGGCDAKGVSQETLVCYRGPQRPSD